MGQYFTILNSPVRVRSQRKVLCNKSEFSRIHTYKLNGGFVSPQFVKWKSTLVRKIEVRVYTLKDEL